MWGRKGTTHADIDRAIATLVQQVIELQKAKATIRDMGDDDAAHTAAMAGMRDSPGYWIIKALLNQRLLTEVSMGDPKYAPGLGLALAILVLKVELGHKQEKEDKEESEREEAES